MREHLEYPDMPYPGLLSRAAARCGSKTAIVFGNRRISYRELDSDASRLARAFLALGLAAGDRVALYMPNCPEFEIAFFGACRAGLVPTPLNPSYKDREVQYQLTESEAAALMLHASLLPVVERVRDEVPGLRHLLVIGESAPEGFHLFTDLLASQEDLTPEIETRSSDLAALPFSSGTTGRSKGVMLTHRNLVCNALQFVDATASTDADAVIIFLPLYHIYGVALMGTAVTAGMTQVLHPRFNLEDVVAAVEREQVSELFVVPPVMLALATAPDLTPEQFRSLRFIKSAAAPLSPEIARRVASRLDVHVMQAYGMTEASPLTHMVPPDEPDYDGEYVGITAADTRCRIVDLDEGIRDLPVGESGEVLVRGPQVMKGYWNAPAETARTLRDGWLYTGDVGRVDSRGRLYIVDRKKEMIKYKAWSIAPAELEALLLEHPAVSDCAVTAQPDPEAGEVPRAYVVLREGSDTDGTDIQRFVAERVASYKQVRDVKIVDSIPRTPSGKILRRVLKAAE